MVTLKHFQVVFETPTGNWALVQFDGQGYSEDGDEYASKAQAESNAMETRPLLWGKYDKAKEQLTLFTTRDSEVPFIILGEFYA